jgi:hypothetical protein
MVFKITILDPLLDKMKDAGSHAITKVYYTTAVYLR